MFQRADAAGLAYTAGAKAESDQFEYTISDGRDGDATAIVTIEVVAENKLPIAFLDTATTQHDTAIKIVPFASWS